MTLHELEVLSAGIMLGIMFSCVVALINDIEVRWRRIRNKRKEMMSAMLDEYAERNMISKEEYK